MPFATQSSASIWLILRMTDEEPNTHEKFISELAPQPHSRLNGELFAIIQRCWDPKHSLRPSIQEVRDEFVELDGRLGIVR